MTRPQTWFSALPAEERGQLQFAGLLGITSLMAFSGSIITAQTLGLIGDLEGSVGGRIVAFLFGAGIAAAGAGILVHTLLAIAASQGAVGPLSAVWLGAERLLRRVTLESALSAITLLPLVWSYWRAMGGLPGPGPSDKVLIAMVLVEFLIIHGFPFVVLASLTGGAFRVVALAGLFGLYCLAAWEAGDGVWGVVSFLYLMVPNVLAFAKRDSNWNVRIAAMSRWALKLFCLLGIAVLLDNSSLQGRENLPLGLFYFASQVLVELFRMAELPRDLGTMWGRVPTTVRQRINFMAQ